LLSKIFLNILNILNINEDDRIDRNVCVSYNLLL